MASVASMASIAYRKAWLYSLLDSANGSTCCHCACFFSSFFKKKAISFCCYSKFSYLCTRFFKITQINTNITRNNGDIH